MFLDDTVSHSGPETEHLQDLIKSRLIIIFHADSLLLKLSAPNLPRLAETAQLTSAR